MADEFKNVDAQHRSCVSMDHEQQVRYWTEKLGCGKDELAAAVAAVGHSLDAVRRELSRAWGYGRLRVGAPERRNRRGDTAPTNNSLAQTNKFEERGGATKERSARARY